MKKAGILGSGSAEQTLSSGFLKHGYEVRQYSMDTIIKQLQAKVKDLKKDKRFQVSLDFIRPPEDKKELDSIQKKYKRRIPAELLELYAACNRTQITTEAVGLPKKMKYALALRSPAIIFELGVSSDDSLANTKLKDKNFLIIDLLFPAGNYVIAYIAENGTLDLHLLTFSEHCNKLHLSFAEYLECSVKYMGIELWQQFFIDDPSKISDHYIYDTTYDLFQEQQLSNFPEEKIKMAKDACKLSAIKNKRDYIAELNAGLQHLKKKKATIRTKKIQFTGASASHLMKVQESLGFSLPDTVLSFYSQVDGLEIEWDLGTISGSINLLPIDEMMGGQNAMIRRVWGKDVVYKGTAESDVRELKGHFMLERYTGDSGFTAVRFDAKHHAFISCATGRSDREEIKMSWGEYLGIHVELMGLWHWLSVVTDGKDAKTGDDLIVDDIKKIFTDFDIKRLL
jgi:cell wall assembly regulator SMI1